LTGTLYNTAIAIFRLLCIHLLGARVFKKKIDISGRYAARQGHFLRRLALLNALSPQYLGARLQCKIAGNIVRVPWLINTKRM